MCFPGQIANGALMPSMIPITEPQQQEFIVNLTEDGQPEPEIMNEVSFHNISNSHNNAIYSQNSETDTIQMIQQPDHQQQVTISDEIHLMQPQNQPTIFVHEDEDIDQIRIRSPPAIIELE